MGQRSKRFYEVGVLAKALEDSEEQAALSKFFRESLLVSPEVEQPIRAVVSAVLTAQKLDGSVGSFQELAGQNKLAIADVNQYLKRILDPHGEGATGDNR